MTKENCIVFTNGSAQALIAQVDGQFTPRPADTILSVRADTGILSIGEDIIGAVPRSSIPALMAAEEHFIGRLSGGGVQHETRVDLRWVGPERSASS